MSARTLSLMPRRNLMLAWALAGATAGDALVHSQARSVPIPTDTQRVTGYSAINRSTTNHGVNDVPQTGYWWPHPSPKVRQGELAERVAQALRGVQPVYFKEDQILTPPVALPSGYEWDADHLYAIEWVYLGRDLPPESTTTVRGTDWRVASGAALLVAEVHGANPCKVGQACPQSGIWLARVPADHPQVHAFNVWNQQAYVSAGEAMPHPQAAYQVGIPEANQVASKDVTWHYRGQPNRENQGLIHIEPPQVVA